MHKLEKVFKALSHMKVGGHKPDVDPRCSNKELKQAIFLYVFESEGGQNFYSTLHSPTLNLTKGNKKTVEAWVSQWYRKGELATVPVEAIDEWVRIYPKTHKREFYDSIISLMGKEPHINWRETYKNALIVLKEKFNLDLSKSAVKIARPTPMEIVMAEQSTRWVDLMKKPRTGRGAIMFGNGI